MAAQMGHRTIRPARRARRAARALGERLLGVYNQASALQTSGQFAKARRLFAQILDQQPDCAPVLYNLGRMAFDEHHPRRAVPLLEQAVAIAPESAPCHGTLAAALLLAGNRKRAKAEFDRALQLDPECVEALFVFARALRAKGELNQAIGYLEKLLRLQPGHTWARNNLGNCYLALSRFEQAETCFEQTIQQQPQAIHGYANLGNLHRRQGHWDKAEAYLRRALAIAPRNPVLWANLTFVLQGAHRFVEALETGRRAVSFGPDTALAHIALGSIYGQLGQPDETLRCAARAYDAEPENSEAEQHLLFIRHYCPDVSPRELAEGHRRWASRHAPSPDDPPRHANPPDPERRLRIGYVSGDFQEHPVAFFLAPVLEAHNRERIEVACYSSAAEDHWTERLRRQASLWRRTEGLDDAALERLIRDDGIDILVDLSGHTEGSRLPVFGRKPAPVQASWLAYFNTTGVAAVDYLIVDSYLAPPGEDAPFIEQPLRLDGCYLTYQIPSFAPPVSPPPGLRRGFTTYGCFNALPKIGRRVLSIWGEILRRDSTARLVLKNKIFADAACGLLYRGYLRESGLPQERIELLGPSPHEEMFQAWSQVDVALDPFPYNGGTTTCEALAAGVPVIALRGDRFVSRVSTTILSNAGLPELVAATEGEYVEKAVALGRSPELVAALRHNLRAALARSTLCDTAGFTRKLENAYREIWRRWCDRQTGA